MLFGTLAPPANSKTKETRTMKLCTVIVYHIVRIIRQLTFLKVSLFNCLWPLFFCVVKQAAKVARSVMQDPRQDHVPTVSFSEKVIEIFGICIKCRAYRRSQNLPSYLRGEISMHVRVSDCSVHAND